MIAETQEEHAILGPKHALEEHLQVLLMLLGEVLLAAAGVHDQPQRQRNVLAPGEKRDRLRDGVLKNLHVVARETVHQRSSRIARGERDIHEIHPGTQWRGFLRSPRSRERSKDEEPHRGLQPAFLYFRPQI